MEVKEVYLHKVVLLYTKLIHIYIIYGSKGSVFT